MGNSTSTTTTNNNNNNLNSSSESFDHLPDTPDLPAKNISDWTDKEFFFGLQALNDGQGPCTLFTQALFQQQEDPVLLTYWNVCSLSYLDKSFAKCLKGNRIVESPTEFLSEFELLLQKVQSNTPISSEELKVLRASTQCMTLPLVQEFSKRIQRMQDPDFESSVLSEE